jgi:phenylalanyl-tRNA synthetase beta chain
VWSIPTFRVDLKQEVDLIEEVARLHGVDKIPSTPPRGAIGANEFDPVYDEIGEARRIFTGLGLNEAQGQTLISNSEFQISNGLALINPLSSDMDALRPSLLPGLIHSLRHNIARKNYDVALFEIGRVFQQRSRQRPARRKTSVTNSPARCWLHLEERRVAIAITGQARSSLLEWSGTRSTLDISDLKGLSRRILRALRRARCDLHAARGSHFALHRIRRSRAGRKIAAGRDGAVLSSAGAALRPARPRLSRRIESGSVAGATKRRQVIQAAPAVPSIRRDVAMLVPESRRTTP